MEWGMRRPGPVRFGCPAAGTDTNSVKLPAPIVPNVVRVGSGFSRFAGDLDLPPGSIPVPFSDETVPLLVVKADLRRILEAHKSATNFGDTPPQQLNATLQIAYVDRILPSMKGSEMRGRVMFDFAIIDPQSGRTNWAQRISTEHKIRPAYVTSRSVEEALTAAYCAALVEFDEGLGSMELQAALRR
jgi:hypothetical protein